MRIRWSVEAANDLYRLYDFLAPLDTTQAVRAVQALDEAVRRLRAHPRLGRPLVEFGPRQVRRLIVGSYEIRYEVQDEAVSILRIWHVREDR